MKDASVLLQVLGAASSVVDFVATHPYPVNGWDYLDYVAGNAPNFQVCHPTQMDKQCNEWACATGKDNTPQT